MPPHNHSHGHSSFRRSPHHSGRGNLFYLYEEPECYCNGIPCLCPDIGSLDAAGNPKPNTLERRNPLPQGRYWFDAFGANIPRADNWLKAFQGSGIHTVATQSFPDSDPSRIRNWYLFTYTPVGGTVVTWDTALGFPSVAAPNVASSVDTAQTPDLPLGPLDELANWANKLEVELGGSIGGLAKALPYAMVGGAIVGSYLLLKEFGIIRKGKKKSGKS